MNIGRRRPVVKTMLLCEGATLDPATKRYTLSGVFHRLEVGGFPCPVPPMIAYIAMTEVQGRHQCGLYLNDLESGQVLVGREGRFGGSQPTDIVELTLQVLPRSHSDVPPLIHAGLYEVAFLIDEQRVAYCPFVVRQAGAGR
jgi:hypothetical protein